MTVYLDRRAIDDYIFTALVSEGYVPDIKEVHTITDIVVDLLVDCQLIEEDVIAENLEALTADFDDEDEDDGRF
jgi:hypothetical protein